MIIVCLGVLAGCGQTATLFLPEKDTESPFQITAPWDKNLYNTLSERASAVKPDLDESVKGGIVPHHLIAGHLTAAFFETIAVQKPSVILLIGPDHFDRGHGRISTTERDWKTPYGTVKTDQKLLHEFQDRGLAVVNEEVMKEEHSIYSLIPFIAQAAPKSRVASLVLPEKIPKEKLDNLAFELGRILPDDAVIIASIDFSHYQTPTIADLHDELTKNVIHTFDFDRLDTLEIDSVSSLFVFLKLMERFGTQKIAHELHTNSGTLVGAPDTKETTSHYSPYFVTGEKSQTEKRVSILHFGDIMLDRNVKKQIDTHGEDYLLEKLAGNEGRFFRGMDIVAANLEGPFADYRRETTKEIAFHFDPKLIPMLKRYNFSLFTLANNHSTDMSRKGFEESKKHLEDAGIDFYGEEYSLDEDAFLVKEVGGVRIAFIGANDTHTPIDADKITALIQQGKKEARHVIVNMHWGQEYQLVSHPRQQFLAHAFIDAGADVIIGHHPHVVQEIEVYKNKPIFYSLGNFIFDQYFSKETQEGLGIGLFLHPEKTSVFVLPLESNKSQVTQMDYEKAKVFLKDLIDRSRLGEYSFDGFRIDIPG